MAASRLILLLVWTNKRPLWRTICVLTQTPCRHRWSSVCRQLHNTAPTACYCCRFHQPPPFFALAACGSVFLLSTKRIQWMAAAYIRKTSVAFTSSKMGKEKVSGFWKISLENAVRADASSARGFEVGLTQVMGKLCPGWCCVCRTLRSFSTRTPHHVDR